jgi:hypothetical protein
VSAKLLAALALAAALPPATANAAAYVYWGNEGTETIGRADVDGASNIPSFINGVDRVSAIATDKSHIYWASSRSSAPFTGSIGRASIDGTAVEPALIPRPSFVSGVAVDAQHVYWSEAGAGRIGRANLDGTAADPNFITGINAPNGIAVDAAHIYWADHGDGNPGSGKIGYATLGGAVISPGLVTGINSTSDVEVDASHIYWTNTFASHSIGRSDINGGGPVQAFISTANDPLAIALDLGFQDIWWSNANVGTLSRANIADGSGRNDNAVTGASQPFGIEVDHGFAVPKTPISNAFTIGKPKRNKRRGTARLPVTVPGPGTLTLRGEGVKPQRPVQPARAARFVNAAGTVKLAIVAKGKAKRRLNRTGKVKLRLKITYTPTGGLANIKKKRVKLIKR